MKNSATKKIPLKVSEKFIQIRIWNLTLRKSDPDPLKYHPDPSTWLISGQLRFLSPDPLTILELHADGGEPTVHHAQYGDDIQSRR
jgi:hypothetical protein